MAGLASGDFDERPDFLGFFRGAQSQTDQVTKREGQKQAGEIGSRVGDPKDQPAYPQVGLPVPEPLFDGHAFGVQVHDLLFVATQSFGDQQIPGFLVAQAPKDDEVEGFFGSGMVIDGIPLDLAGLKGESAQGAGLALEVHHHVLFSPYQERNTGLGQFLEQSHPSIPPVEDEKRTSFGGRSGKFALYILAFF